MCVGNFEDITQSVQSAGHALPRLDSGPVQVAEGDDIAVVERMRRSRSSHVVDESPIERAVVYRVGIFQSVSAAIAARATTDAGTDATSFFRSVKNRVASRDEFLVRW